jgi:hypothetical protein
MMIAIALSLAGLILIAASSGRRVPRGAGR